MKVKEVQEAMEVEMNVVMLDVEVVGKRKDQKKEVNELVGMINVMLKLLVKIVNDGNNLFEYQRQVQASKQSLVANEPSIFLLTAIENKCLHCIIACNLPPKGSNLC